MFLFEHELRIKQKNGNRGIRGIIMFIIIMFIIIIFIIIVFMIIIFMIKYLYNYL